MSVGTQRLTGWGKYFGTVRHSVESGQEAATTAVGVIIDTLTNGPAALVRQNGGQSTIGPELRITGTLMCSANMTVDGILVGDIRAKGHVTIGETGVVLGNIYAEEVTVHGRAEGILYARKVRLCRLCQVKGEVVHARLEVEHGAFFEGECGHSDDPAGEAPITAQ